MFREPLRSSLIAAVAYDEENEILEVEFATGAVYRYRGISEDVFDAFRRARSLGGTSTTTSGMRIPGRR
jgi:hypothetical protein